ncbi:MAG: FecR family protein [Gammaproteobacteria bacterium]|nr:FecR family protein [Gammaproteobacteria bacterium]
MRIAIVAFVLLMQIMPVWAANDSGQVLFVAGRVTAERDDIVVLKKADRVFEKDVIVTADRSRGQLLMKDGAKIALRPETRFLIEEYFQAGDELEQPDGSIIVAAQDSAVTELVKGGFRTITGAIGRDNPDAYVVDTPAATLGIRGTHYNTVWCAGDCRPPPGVTVTAPILDGLYLGVVEGALVVANNTGEYLVTAGEFVYVRDRDTPPVRLREKPIPLIDTFPTLTTERFEPLEFPPPPGIEVPDGFPLGPDGPILVVPKINITGASGFRPVTLASGPISGSAPTAFAASSALSQGTLSGNELIDFLAPFPGASDNASYAIGTSSTSNIGFDPVTGLGWGRWSGGLANVTPAGSSAINADLSSQSLHWVYGRELDVRPAMPSTGTASFTLLAGNTQPTDTLGNTGVLGNASLFANFTTATVDSELLLVVGGRDWQASGSGSITSNLFDGVYDSVVVGGQTGGSGNFGGFFAAPGSNSLPSGAGLTYGLSDGQDVSVSGAVVFGQPNP